MLVWLKADKKQSLVTKPEKLFYRDLFASELMSQHVVNNLGVVHPNSDVLPEGKRPWRQKY